MLAICDFYFREFGGIDLLNTQAKRCLLKQRRSWNIIFIDRILWMSNVSPAVHVSAGFWSYFWGFFTAGILLIMSGAREFETTFNQEIVQRPDDNIYIPMVRITPVLFRGYSYLLFALPNQMLKSLGTVQEKIKEQPFGAPYSVKARALLLAHLDRMALPARYLYEGMVSNAVSFVTRLRFALVGQSSVMSCGSSPHGLPLAIMSLVSVFLRWVRNGGPEKSNDTVITINYFDPLNWKPGKLWLLPDRNLRALAADTGDVPLKMYILKYDMNRIVSRRSAVPFADSRFFRLFLCDYE